MRVTRPLFALLAVALFVLAGCSAQPTPTVQTNTSEQGLVVVTSISPLADLIKNVAGDKAKVVNLVPQGSDPHDYDPKPADVKQVTTARVFFANGLGYEHYLEKLVQNARNPQLKMVTLTDGIQPVGQPEEHHDEADQDHAADKDHEPAGNAHAWLSVTNAMKYVEEIRDTLVQVDAANKATYEANATAYLKQLADLDQWVKEQVATIPAERRKMVVLHDAWPYYADRYGLTDMSLLKNPEAEPSAKDYAVMVDRIKQEKVPAVFGEAGFNPKLVKRLAADTGVQYIDNLLDDTLANEGDTYVKMIKYDTQLIVKALR